MGKFSAREKADCAKREVGQRKYVYLRRVADGKMTQHLADRQIAVMQEIADEYGAAADLEDVARQAEEAKGRLL